MDPGGLVAIITDKFCDNPGQVRYPLPNMQDLSNGLHGCTVFSKIDLVKGYH
jgi:hypothetical protein